MSSLYTPRTTERVYLNNVDISEITIGYSIRNNGALIYIFLPSGKRLKTTKGKDYRTFVYGVLRIEKEAEV